MWNFVSPRVIFGDSSLSALGDLSFQRVLIVTDQNLVQIGLVDQVVSALSPTGAEIAIFDQVQPDPTLEDVEGGRSMAEEFQPEWIIGVGGGSPLDAAKAIWVLYERPDLSAPEINPFITLDLRKKCRLITIPTTSGTGAEVTWAIVLTEPESGRKMGLGNRENLADIALVDPALAAGMPPGLTADTGLDALTHAIEGYICTWHSDLTDGLCLDAARTIYRNLPLAYEAARAQDPAREDYLQARKKMHHAATCAGLGFGNAMASLAHAMGHALGSIFKIPHGRAVGLFLPYTLEFAGGGDDPSRIATLARALGLEEPAELPGAALAAALRNLAAELESPLGLSDLGLDESDFNKQLDALVNAAFNDTQIITAPRPPSFQKLQQLFEYAYSGKQVDF